jgi:hypothetical protein
MEKDKVNTTSKNPSSEKSIEPTKVEDKKTDVDISNDNDEVVNDIKLDKLEDANINNTDINTSNHNTLIGNKLIKAPKSLTPIGHMTDVVAISNDLGFASPLEYLTFMVKSSTNSITREGDALLLYQKSREINVGWTTALENIYMIPTKGGTKISISVHLAKAMLITRSNVTWKLIKDFEPAYNYLALINDEKVIFKYNEPLPEKHVIYNTTNELKNHDNSNGIIGLIPILKEGKPVIITRVTEYEFRRTRIVNGKNHEDVIHSRFSLKDAEAAELIKPSGNYNKYPNIMIDHRAFMNGARAIAPDILFGMYAPAELDQVEGTTVLLDENGNPIEVIN